MFNPMWLWLAAGHFARDFLPKELVPGFAGSPGQAAPGVQPSPAQAAAPPVTEVLPRAPIGPFPLDAGMEEDYELAVWRACEDQNASPQQIAAFAQGAMQDGFPIAYGVLYKRAIELAQFQESLRVQEAVMRRSQASPQDSSPASPQGSPPASPQGSPPASPQGMPARHEGSPSPASSGPERAHAQGASSPASEGDPSEVEAASSSVSPTYPGAAHAAPVVGSGVGNGRARGKAPRKEASHAGRNGVANGATMTPSADESVDVHVEP
jgi:hypothetical protein